MAERAEVERKRIPSNSIRTFEVGSDGLLAFGPLGRALDGAAAASPKRRALAVAAWTLSLDVMESFH